MLSAFLITLMSVVAGLLLFLAVATSEFYFGRVPSGSDAMGLVIPILAAGAAGVLTFVASIIAGSRGNLDYLGWSRGNATVLMTMAGVCVGCAMFGCLLAWCEKHAFSHPPLLLITGFLFPMGYLSFLTLIAWATPDEVRRSSFLQWLGYGATASPATGTIVIALMTVAYLRKEWDNNRARAEAFQREEWERKRLDAMTPEEKLLESLATYSAEAPLWTLIAGLPDESNAALRKIWIDRALQVPDFKQALHSTIGCEYGNYRHGCVILLCEAPEDKLEEKMARPLWGQSLLQDIRLTTATITQKPDLGRYEDDVLAEHVIHIAQATQRLNLNAELSAALREMLAAIKQKPASENRELCIKALADVEKVP